ncbi:MAG TPA: NAD(P)H-dependent oxidoreductase [Gemmatimonadaceae bacterium]|nr:NAD(P)H-dependent oxidoreductase [Gemmatimonadaceae bacterium]
MIDAAAVQHSREPVRFLVFSASLRADSHNTRLAALAAAVITRRGGSVDHATMAEFDCPSYSEDAQDASGLASGSAEFRRRLEANDAFVIACPEYNASIPGALKNAIDWTSRFRPQPFNTRQALLLSASPSMVGGNRGLWALRIPLEHLGARVFPDMFSLAQAHKALGADGQLTDAAIAGRFDQTIGAFMDLVEAQKHYPCAKKAWYEFLGEHGTPVLERVE